MKNRFVREDDIIIDNDTGLMWQDDNTVNNRINWQEANEMSRQFKLGNYNNWRLPSSDELLSIANKNNIPNLDIIFKNRPFSTWSAFENEDDRFAKAIFYNENNIVPLINIDTMHKSEELFVRYVRDIKQINETSYDTNIKNLTCTCRNWLLTRQQFANNDPRRLCKHLMRELDIDNINDGIRIYKENIDFYKTKDRGFFDDFNTIIDVENTTHKLLYKYGNDWMNLFSDDGIKYGLMRNGTDSIAWTRLYGKPLDYKTVDKFLLSMPKVIYKEDSC